MERILVEDLVKFKMLPFDIYNDSGEKLISAGEILTSGKLLRISQYSELYKDTPKNQRPTQISKEENRQSASDYIPPPVTHTKEIIFDKTVNKTSKIKAQAQVDMKSYYATTMFAVNNNESKDAALMIDEIKTKILSDIGNVIEDVKFCSQLKLLGNYTDCHSLNTAILATAFGYKMEYDSDIIAKITKSALLHDIGISRIPEDLLKKTNPSSQETKVIQSHTQIGYKILKLEMNMSEDICLVALEHHENNDGSGYPFKLSGEQISEMSRIVGMCSFFDDLTSGKTTYKVKNTKEALRVMLEVGSKRFFPELLYKFVNTFNYNDLSTFEEMMQ